MSKINTWSTTAASNNTASPDGWPEGMPPSGVNNSAREMMAQIRDVWNDKEWFQLGSGTGTQTVTRASTTSVTIAANVSTTYHVGRRIKLYGANGGTIYGKIATSSYSAPNTTISFTFDSGTIHSSDTNPTLWVGSTYSNPSTPVIHDTSLGTSAVLPPSQGSVKTYVDTQVTGQDLDFEGDSGTGAVDLDSQSFDIAGGSGIATTASGQTLTVAGEDATTSAKGVASFSSDNFSVSSGAVTIKTGGVENAELANSSVNYGGVSLSLGGSDTTPAMNLSDATNYPASSLTGTIGNSQVATGIDAAKIADGTVSNTEFQYINSLSSNAQTQISARLVAASDLSDVASASTSRTNLGLGTIATQAASNVAVTGGSITGLGSPSASSDAATKNYVDEAVAGLRTRVIAECASTANVNLTNGLEAGDAIDGVTLVAGDRCLIKSQTDATENGLYLAVASGAASRDPEYDTIAEISGSLIVVNQGSTNNDSIWLCTTDSSGSIGSTSITYTKVTPSNTGTVTSIGLAQSGSEFTISGSPVTSSGNITINVNSISATKIGNGDVTDSELSYINSVTSNVQTQLDAKSTAGFSVAMAIAL